MAILTAPSAEYTDVNATVQSSVSGDTVNIPAGVADWGQATVECANKAIAIIGAGPSATIITQQNGMSFRWFACGNNPVRLSNIRFNSLDHNLAIVGLSGPILKFRGDHLEFHKGDSAFGTNHPLVGTQGSGPVWGVIDHSAFYNMARTYFAQDVRQGDGFWGATAWTEFLADPTSFAGSEKFLFYEDCQLIWDNNLTDGNAQGILYGQYGGKAVVRHCTGTGLCFYIDGHGDNGPGGDYGTIMYEVYENDFTESTQFCNDGRQFYLRGGRYLVHDNTITNQGVTPAVLTVYFESDIQSHRIQNTHFYNNSFNGNTNPAAFVTVNDSGQTSAGYSAAHCRLNIEYFLAAPTSGQTFFPYTPYQYPHPLTTSSAIQVVTTPTIASGSQLFAPSLTYDQNVSLPTIPSGSVLYPMLVSDDTLIPISLESAPAISESQLFAPSLGMNITGALLNNQSVLFAPSLSQPTDTPHVVFVVPQEDRTMEIAFEDRTAKVPKQTRSAAPKEIRDTTIEEDSNSRIKAIPRENRTVKVKP